MKRCSYQYARCEEGIELEKVNIRTHIAYQNAPKEEKQAKYEEFSQAVKNYMQHVDICGKESTDEQ